MNKNIKTALRLYITGFTMGVADLIPGVSGGTIAFISGIYEELLLGIKKVTTESLRLLIRLEVKKAVKEVPFKFFIPLSLGIVSAILLLSRLLEFLLDSHGTKVWAYFFGLVLTSVYVVSKRVKVWNLKRAVFFVLASLFAFFLVGSGSVNLPHNHFITFISGAIGICALILPGISGAFILVLLGQYAYILESLNSKNITVIALFLLGATFGLTLFSKVLNWLFKEHHDTSVVVLAGFMLGSLRKIYPFSTNYSNINDALVLSALVIVGMFTVGFLTKYHALKERKNDLK